MPRSRRAKDIPFAPGFRFLTDTLIPPDLAALGWKSSLRRAEGYRNNGSTMGSGDPWIETDLCVDSAGRTVIAWVGYVDKPRRRLRRWYAHPIVAMRATQEGEARGPLAACWEEQVGPPERDGWTCVVRRGRHVWYRVGSASQPMIVLQEPAVAGPCCALRYRAAHGGRFISTESTSDNGSFHNPIAAMEALEEEDRCENARYFEEIAAEIGKAFARL